MDGESGRAKRADVAVVVVPGHPGWAHCTSSQLRTNGQTDRQDGQMRARSRDSDRHCIPGALTESARQAPVRDRLFVSEQLWKYI